MFLSLAEAVEEVLRDGDSVAMEGFTHLIPFAAGHEVIRQRRKHLTLIRMTPDLIYDQLVGMGCADKMVFSWLPGGGGAPEIAISCGEIFIIMNQSMRSFVEKLEFITSLGHGTGGKHREQLGVKTKGPTKLVTDLAVFEPDPETKEMTIVSIHPGVKRVQIGENSGWPARYAAKVAETPVPTAQELEVLRELTARTARAHGEAA